jgi:hypothetical protein
MANIRELILSIESDALTFDEKLAALNQVEETLIAMQQQEEDAVQENVDLIVEAIKVMQEKVDAQVNRIADFVPEKGEKGDKGERGLDGRQGVDGKDGRDGINGRDGKDGVDGISVIDAKIDFDGSLIITLSTGKELNVGEVVAPDLAEKIKLVTSGGAGTVLPSQGGNSGKYLKTDGSALSWATVSGGGGSGTVTSVTGTGTVSGLTLTGTVTTSGNLTLGGSIGTLNQNTTGSAATLTTARAIYGNNFDGSAALTGIIASTYGGTGNGFTKFSGATTAEKTYTLPDATTTILTTNAAVTVGQGGTGQTSYTDGQLLIGNSTGNTLTKTTLTAGTGVSITNGSGSISIAAPLAKQTDVFTSGTSATYTAPANTQWVKITVVGKGGNGGGTTSQRGSGGGAGGIAIKWLAITAGQTLIYTVNNVSFPNFVTSGTYTLASDITGYGGTAGTSVAYAASFTAGGLGGTATGGDINIRGGYGGSAFGTSTAVTTQQSGFGGSNMFGAGGYAVGVAINAGVDGLGYGVGGGGSIGSTTVGLGTNGVIIFEAY